MGCIFCEIIAEKRIAYKVWEDDKHLAFLSIFPNTPGTTVVVTKEHLPSYAFDLSDEALTLLTLAAKKAGKLLDQKLEDVGRTAMVLEGFGVDHAHAKLFPMHGTANMSEWQPIHSNIDTFFPKYQGYISSHDGPRAGEEDLEKLAKLINR